MIWKRLCSDKLNFETKSGQKTIEKTSFDIHGREEIQAEMSRGTLNFSFKVLLLSQVSHILRSSDQTR